jgi:hypothetical protein
MKHPVVKMHSDGEDIFLSVNGVNIAKRGASNTPQANSWVPLEPGWTVIDKDYPRKIEITFEGVRVH